MNNAAPPAKIAPAKFAIGGSMASAVGWMALVLVAATPSHAQEHCVSCTGPVGLYRCTIDGARPGVTSSLQLLCVERMARDGGHASCSVKRGVTVFDCDGPVRRIMVTDADAPPVNPGVGGPATGTGGAASSPPPAQASDASPKGEPKTMLEVAKRAKEATDAEFKKAGEQMKSSAEKTNTGFKNAWRCMTTFFTRCGGE